MIESAEYLADGSIKVVVDGSIRTVPDDPNNKGRQLLSEWEQSNTITPYTQDIGDLRALVRESIKTEALSRLSVINDSFADIDIAKLIFISFWDVLGATGNQQMQSAKLIVDHAASRIQMAKSATREQLESYDAKTDPG